MPQSDLELFLVDKNDTSWSLRPWLLLVHHGIAFTETSFVAADAHTPERLHVAQLRWVERRGVVAKARQPRAGEQGVGVEPCQVGVDRPARARAELGHADVGLHAVTGQLAGPRTLRHLLAEVDVQPSLQLRRHRLGERRMAGLQAQVHRGQLDARRSVESQCDRAAALHPELGAAGLSFGFALQTFIIVGGVLRLVPLTGITLPFVSYGGTSIVANFVMLALLMLVSHRAVRHSRA